MRQKLLLVVLGSLLGLSAGSALADEPAESALAETDQETVYLKPLEVTESRDTTQRISKDEMDRVNATNLWEAMSLAPGVTMSVSGARNDSRLSIRGFSQDRIRVLLDGVPVYIPYDGNEDFSRYLIDDLETIEVSKGYSSVITGTGALGGTINLVSARPKKELELKARYVNYFDSRGDDMARHVTASAGTKQDMYFLKLTGAFYEQDFFRISDNFHGSPVTSYNSGRDSNQNQPRGRRKHSTVRDKKLNFMAGLTPTDDSELVFSYIAQRGMKDQPPYDGKKRADTNNPARRHWQWPEWDKDSYILSGKFSPADGLQVKANAYYDTYKNTLADYRYDYTYTHLDNSSKYEDHSYGSRVEIDYEINTMHSVVLSGSYRRDAHKRLDHQALARSGRPYTPWHMSKRLKDDTWIGSMEYTLRPVDRLAIVLGVSYTKLDPVKVWDTDDTWGEQMKRGNGHEAWDGQGGIFYDVAENHQVYGTIASKTRMPSMRERYRVTSNNAGNAGVYDRLPNPGLKPERAIHYEVGYRGTIQNKIKLGASLFHSDVKDRITAVTWSDPLPNDPRHTLEQNQNLEKTAFNGFELTMDVFVNETLTMGANYSYMDWKVRKRPDPDKSVKLTDLPKAQANAYLTWSPIPDLSITPRMEYRAETYYTSQKDAITDEFFLGHIKAVYNITENFAVEAGVDNVFDTHYEYEEGYSMPGRTFYAGVSVEF